MRTLLRTIGLSSLAAMAFGCGGDATGPAARPVYWALVMNYHAVALTTHAPWNSVQLHATAVAPDGTPIAGAGAVTYQAIDSTLAVTADGHVTARAATTASLIVATLTIDNVTHVDTTVITTANTPATPPKLAFLSVQTADPTDSTKMAAGGNPTKDMTTIATDSGGVIGSPFDIPFWYTSSDPTIATIDRRSGQITGLRPGQITITVESNVYGILRRDSIRFTIADPLQVEFEMVKRVPVGDTTPFLAFDPGTLTAGVGANVTFVNISGLMGDVVFDDSTAALESQVFPTGSGNIEPFQADLTDFISTILTGQKQRLFLTAGTYTFHSRLYGTTGKLIIK